MIAGASAEISEIVPAAMRSASIASTPARAQSRSSVSVAGGSSRWAASSAVNASSSAADGRSPCHKSHVVSSKVARAANSPTGSRQ